jgi:ABC-type multidrug transport system ATPase subunit/pSer/pThr/pTyr-binding forkhead associated (FHA) protein
VIELDRPSITLGRDAGCDVVIDTPWVAPVHARIELLGEAHHVVADGAPVLIGGERVRESMLHDGDVLRLVDPSTGGFVGIAYANPLARRIASVQHFATPPGQALLTIGRAGADLVLDQPLVARRHAELAWQDGRHVLRDGGSAHGTYVNGARITERPLAPGDVVQIGTFRLTYDGDSLDTLDQRGAIRIDAQHLVRRAGDKVLLDDASLSIEPCEFVAIVGGSGAGKSTLMMALCGFLPADQGRVLINGDDLYASFDAYRSILGYVPQEDILHRALPVRRALRYAARLRLPADTAPAEIEDRITRVLELVEMSEHEHKIIDELSGGQRKRVSIACELLAEPPLLFLDEPTSGLDPGLERKLMFTLRKLADGGRTIVLVTHATANIRQCDHIVFLSGGRVVYFGPPFQAPELFGAVDFADIYVAVDSHTNPRAPEEWQARYRTSLQHQKYAVERPARVTSVASASASEEKERRRRRYAHSPLFELRVLVRRYLDLIVNDRRNLVLLLLQAPVIALLLLLVAGPDSFFDRVGAKKLGFMLSATGVWFGVINAAREICKETPVLRRERLAGLGVGPYVLSKIIALALLVCVQSALLLCVLALRVRFPTHGVIVPGVLEIYVTIVLAGLAGISLGLCVSVVASTADKATSLIPIVLVPQVLFAGIMFGLAGVTAAASWLTSSRWSMDALGAIVDLNRLPTPGLPFAVMLPAEPQYAHTPSILLGAWGVLAGHAAGFLAVAWLALRSRR